LTLPTLKAHCFIDGVRKNPHEYRGFVQRCLVGTASMRYAARGSEPRQHRLPRGQAQKENITWQLE
jgi:hypothetical protein